MTFKLHINTEGGSSYCGLQPPYKAAGKFSSVTCKACLRVWRSRGGGCS